MVGGDSVAAASAATSVIVEYLAAYIESGAPIAKLEPSHHAFVEIMEGALSQGPASGGGDQPLSSLLTTALRRRIHHKPEIAADDNDQLPELRLPAGGGVASPELWHAAIRRELAGAGFKVVAVECVDQRCLRFMLDGYTPDGQPQRFTASGPTFARRDVEALVVDDRGFALLNAAAVLFRVRKRPDLLTQEWDELIDEQMTLLNENPLAP